MLGIKFWVNQDGLGVLDMGQYKREGWHHPDRIHLKNKNYYPAKAKQYFTKYTCFVKSSQAKLCSTLID